VRKNEGGLIFSAADTVLIALAGFILLMIWLLPRTFYLLPTRLEMFFQTKGL
jgi:hypothetical protein